MDIEILLPEKIVLLWKIMRRVFNSSPESIPRFVGWVIKHLVDCHQFWIQLLNTAQQGFSTVIECVKQSQELASASNMKFTYIPADGGAAMRLSHVA